MIKTFFQDMDGNHLFTCWLPCLLLRDMGIDFRNKDGVEHAIDGRSLIVLNHPLQEICATSDPQKVELHSIVVLDIGPDDWDEGGEDYDLFESIDCDKKIARSMGR